jgi:peptidoglycan/LPS O-acetylase OafA/YrhL
MILLLLGNPALRNAFSRSWAIWLGLLSFPIYLLHGPIMLSAGAAVFNKTLPTFGQPASALTACLISIALTLACAVPLIWLDRAWTKLLGRLTKPFLKKPSPAPLAPTRLVIPAPQPPGPTSCV